MSGPVVRKGTKERSFWNRERGARIVNLFSGWVSFDFWLCRGMTERGLKMIQDSELVIKLAVYVCITGKEIKIMK